MSPQEDCFSGSGTSLGKASGDCPRRLKSYVAVAAISLSPPTRNALDRISIASMVHPGEFAAAQIHHTRG